MADKNKAGTVEKLNDNNYCSWKFEMKMLLMKEKLWQYVNDEYPKTLTPEWNNKNEEALGTIALGCEKSQYPTIRQCKYAKQAWDELRKKHEERTIVSKVILLKAVFSKKLIEGGNPHDFAVELEELFQQMDDNAMVLPDLQKAVIFLASLPDSYDTLVTSLESRDESQLSLAFVKQKIFSEYDRRQSRENQQTPDEQLMLARRKNFEKKKPTCWHCNSPHHLRKDCPTYQPEIRSKVNIVYDNEADEEPVLFMASNGCNEIGWYIDSGATKHMCNDKSLFENFSAKQGASVVMANGVKAPEEGRGSIRLMCQTECESGREILIEEVLFVPQLDVNLISVSKLLSRGFSVTFEGNRCTISKGQRLIAFAEQRNGLFRLQEMSRALISRDKQHNELCKHAWHRRLGHRDINVLQKISRQELAIGFKLVECGVDEKCECCLEAKLTRSPFPSATEKKTTKILELLHTDVCGPISPPSYGGHRYVMTLIDDYSGYTRVYLMKQKSEAEIKIKQFVAEMGTRFGRKPQVIRSDRGGEYTGNALLNFYKQQGITPEFTVPYSPQQNGKAERKNRSLIEMTRCLIGDSQLDKRFWGEAILTANYLQNRLPSESVERTPYELWMGRKPNYSNLKRFGCQAWVQTPSVKRSKLDPAATRMKFIGYAPHQKGYKFWHPQKQRVVISRDASFIELDNGSYASREISTPQISTITPSPVMTEDIDEVDVQEELQVSRDTEIETEVLPRDEEELNPDIEAPNNENEVGLRRSTRSTRNIIDPYLREHYHLYLAMEITGCDPLTYDEAVSRDDSEQWKAAMDEEMQALTSNGSWVLVERPKTNIVGCKWVYKQKYDENGKPVRYRARLVAQGFSQKFGVDYEEVFAPVVKPTTIRLMLTIAGTEGLCVRHVDVKTAFLNADLEEEIYMRQPEGYVDPLHPDKVCLLKKSLYGLKQSARQWNLKLCETLEKMNFKRCPEDDCLFVRDTGSGKHYVLAHVDDMLSIGAIEEELIQFENELGKHFMITSMGKVHHFLGMKIERSVDGIFYVSQTPYISKLVNDFKMADAKYSKVPMDQSYVKTKDTTQPFPHQTLYRSLIGGLLYLSVTTRPDISAAASILSRKLCSPTIRAWTEAKRVLRYLNGSRDMRLRLGNGTNSDLFAYVDADHAGDMDDRKSNSGHVFLFRGSPLSWACRKQESVSISSTEAEYVSLSEACQEMAMLRRLLKALGYEQTKPTVMLEDNQSCIQLAASERVGRRLKHIDTRYHYVRELKKRGIIDIIYCPTEEMAADMLTKPIGPIKMERFRKIIGLHSTQI